MRPINLVRSICVLFLALCTSGVLSAEAPLVKQFVLASEKRTQWQLIHKFRLQGLIFGLRPW